MVIYKAFIEYYNEDEGIRREQLDTTTHSKEDAIMACISELEDDLEDDEENECREALESRGYWTLPYVSTTVLIEESEE